MYPFRIIYWSIIFIIAPFYIISVFVFQLPRVKWDTETFQFWFNERELLPCVWSRKFFYHLENHSLVKRRGYLWSSCTYKWRNYLYKFFSQIDIQEDSNCSYCFLSLWWLGPFYFVFHNFRLFFFSSYSFLTCGSCWKRRIWL